MYFLGPATEQDAIRKLRMAVTVIGHSSPTAALPSHIPTERTVYER